LYINYNWDVDDKTPVWFDKWFLLPQSRKDAKGFATSHLNSTADEVSS
jgi:hypothetical protein